MPVLVVAFSGLLAMCALFGGGGEEILGVLPAIALVLALAFGRYPGEDVIFRLARRVRRRRGRVSPPLRLSRRRLTTRLDRIAFLAASRPMRAPPALLPTSL